MAEPPDFEQIARAITDEAAVDAFDTTTDRRVTAFVIAALRQVWNARGSADAKAAEHEMTSNWEASFNDVERAIKELDR